MQTIGTGPSAFGLQGNGLGTQQQTRFSQKAAPSLEPHVGIHVRLDRQCKEKAQEEAEQDRAAQDRPAAQLTSPRSQPGGEQ